MKGWLKAALKWLLKAGIEEAAKEVTKKRKPRKA